MKKKNKQKEAGIGPNLKKKTSWTEIVLLKARLGVVLFYRIQPDTRHAKVVRHCKDVITGEKNWDNPIWQPLKILWNWSTATSAIPHTLSILPFSLSLSLSHSLSCSLYLSLPLCPCLSRALSLSLSPSIAVPFLTLSPLFSLTFFPCSLSLTLSFLPSLPYWRSNKSDQPLY